MKKNFDANFYFQVSLWIFLSFILTSFVCTFRNIASNGNESDATQTISSIRQLQARLAAKNQGKYASEFGELFRAVTPDNNFSPQNRLIFDGHALEMNGYIFEIEASAKKEVYSLTAAPLETSCCKRTGTRHLYTDSTLNNVKFTEENRPANADDPAI